MKKIFRHDISSRIRQQEIFDCEAGKKYLQQLKEKRKEELQTLTALTGKTYSDWDVTASNEEKNIPEESSYKTAAIEIAKPDKKGTGILFAALGVMGLVSFVRIRRRNNI